MQGEEEEKNFITPEHNQTVRNKEDNPQDSSQCQPTPAFPNTEKSKHVTRRRRQIHFTSDTMAPVNEGEEQGGSAPQDRGHHSRVRVDSGSEEFEAVPYNLFILSRIRDTELEKLKNAPDITEEEALAEGKLHLQCSRMEALLYKNDLALLGYYKKMKEVVPFLQLRASLYEEILKCRTEKAEKETSPKAKNKPRLSYGARRNVRSDDESDEEDTVAQSSPSKKKIPQATTTPLVTNTQGTIMIHSVIQPRDVKDFDGAPEADTMKFLKEYERMSASQTDRERVEAFGRYVTSAAANWLETAEQDLKSESRLPRMEPNQTDGMT